MQLPSPGVLLQPEGKPPSCCPGSWQQRRRRKALHRAAVPLGKAGWKRRFLVLPSSITSSPQWFGQSCSMQVLLLAGTKPRAHLARLDPALCTSPASTQLRASLWSPSMKSSGWEASEPGTARSAQLSIREKTLNSAPHCGFSKHPPGTDPRHPKAPSRSSGSQGKQELPVGALHHLKAFYFIPLALSFQASHQ